MKIITKYLSNIDMEIDFLIGQNAQDNFDMIDSSNKYDLWFHINNLSSCHVIAKLPYALNRNKLNTIIKTGAVLCKQNTSKIIQTKKIDIIYTQIKNIKKTLIIGQVTIGNSHIINI